MPRVLYVGDVPVEETYHGSLLLYRLLEGYSQKLTIIETGVQSHASRRLPGVTYISIPLTNQRYLNTRFHPYVMSWYSLKSTRISDELATVLCSVEFDCVVTVAHGVGWLTAAKIAESKRVPLHLAVHDDWPRVANVPGVFRKWVDESFGRVYRQATSRMCVSPTMRARYLEQHGCDSYVIYPTRGVNCVEAGSEIRRRDEPFTVAFAGTINSQGYVQALVKLRDALTTVNGNLAIFGPLTKAEAMAGELAGPNVTLHGLVNPAELLKRLREEADVLFVPMSFNPEHRSNMEMAFPSKLADYTAVGLPVLIYGPDYCSVVRWARENQGVAEVVENEDSEFLMAAIRRLASDPEYRVTLGERALEIGQQYFASGVAQQIFTDLLCKSASVE